MRSFQNRKSWLDKISYSLNLNSNQYQPKSEIVDEKPENLRVKYSHISERKCRREKESPFVNAQ